MLSHIKAALPALLPTPWGGCLTPCACPTGGRGVQRGPLGSKRWHFVP